MDTTKFLLGTIGGAITALILGYLLYGMLLMGFFESNLGTATGVMKGTDELNWLWMIIGHLFAGAFISYIFLKWANISTFSGGASAGAIIGFLMAGSYDLIGYATTNVYNLTAALADIVVTAIIVAITGGVVGLILGMGQK